MRSDESGVLKQAGGWEAMGNTFSGLVCLHLPFWGGMKSELFLNKKDDKH